jgi:hypothetical protein
MSEKEKKNLEIAYVEIIKEAIKGIKNEILLYSIVVISLLICGAYFNVEILRELKWPIALLFVISLVFYFLVITIQNKKKNLEESNEEKKDTIDSFHAKRIEKIKVGDTPEKLIDSAKFILHVVPSKAFDSSIKLDLTPLSNSQGLLPLFEPSSYGLDFRYNVHGILVSWKFPQEKFARLYTQVFNNGIIEAVDTFIFNYVKGCYLTAKYEGLLIAALKRYLSIQKQLDTEPPFFIKLSLLGMSGYDYFLASGSYTDIEAVNRIYSRQFGFRPTREDYILTSLVTIKNFECDAAEVMKPIFDEISRAFGMPKSPCYDEKDKWKGLPQLF